MDDDTMLCEKKSVQGQFLLQFLKKKNLYNFWEQKYFYGQFYYVFWEQKYF